MTIAVAPHRAADVPAPSIPSPRDRSDAGTPIGRAKLLTHLLLADGHDVDALATLEAGIDEHVDVWTPAVHVRSRFDLMRLLTDLDDSIGGVDVRFTVAEGSSSTVFLGWLATGRFVRPVFLDDDHMLEPNGAVLRLAGSTSLSFTPTGRADQIRCYYDRLSLVEQLLAPRAPTLV